MDVSTIVTTAIITATIQGIINTAFYKLIERQDRKLDGLSERIQDLEDKKIEDIKNRLASGSVEFEGLHDEMEERISRPDYLLHQERCDAKMRDLTEDVDAIREKQTEIGNEVSGIHSIVELIARNLNITLK